MVFKKIAKSILFAKIVIYSVQLYFDVLTQSIAASVHGRRAKSRVTSPESPKELQNIVVIGASFSGYHAAKLLTNSLPPNSPYQVVVVEPNSHFQFTWVLPRFCVVEGHEHKAFIPYGPYLKPAPKSMVRWIQDRVVSVSKESIRLQSSTEEIPYAFLIIATGSGAEDSLPSRVGAPGKPEGVERCRKMQMRIKESKRPLIVGGGAAGVELATDAKSLYPEKHVALVHSRPTVMQRFGSELQAAALEGLERLGVEVHLSERMVSEDVESGTVLLKSGKVLECDAVIHCTGQKPSSQLLSDLAPGSISESGHIRVKPTLQIADDSLPNVYIIGDVADTGTRNPNARSAMRQGQIAADNITRVTWGKKPSHHYKPWWGEAVIKLTLGLENSVTHFGDGKTELVFPGKETDPALMCDGTWRHMGVTPFEDSSWPQGESEGVGSSAKLEV
ncbi:FAD/NAD(P)-binding domain-containing protein [Eremomyces bilateralis CBS 781.70]|uniref:FAD/NAD(P)-binding domain-containing protein n=1 Tax=Eremomyces bilateralis CBS 781.70 TaxID=1392243 RepID=A0A6G1G2X6_9PEZI|nr:FAD/NAD(P)-binding domain-containing protein [Eremomyces bilateralis CBS 781.70]KAF1812368.1 FAD/NAD(P)-binding domain-containing protein [Eremomyces bilateralis CBS 781.70]